MALQREEESMRFTSTIVLALGLAGAGCGSSNGDLSQGAVTTIPAGDATGATDTGLYGIQVLTQACAGDCSYTVSGALVSVCDVGTKRSSTLTLTQTDGRLQVDDDDPALYVSRLLGGVYKDGHFDVGGFATQQAGAVEITARVTGTISAAGQLMGTARAAGQGTVSNDSISCMATFEITGMK
jgi:hypothetical protein